MTWATPTDVTSRWVGTGAPTDTNLVSALIADAEAVILAEYPLIQDRIDANKLSPGTVSMVVCRMVSRVLRNPEGLTYWQQNTGPFGQGRSFDSKDIWLTDEERNLLAPKQRGKAYSVDPSPAMWDGRRAIFIDNPINTAEPVWVVEDYS